MFENVSRTENDFGINMNKECEEDIELPTWMFDESTAKSSPKWSRTNELKFTNETVVRRVYSLARILHNSLEKLGICYWTSGGTSLGCVRHQGLIPWDDDLDLCVYQKDEGKLIGCLKRLLDDNDYELIVVEGFGYRVFHRTDSEMLPSEHQIHRYPFGDIFVMKRKAEICYIVSVCGRTLYPEEYYYNKDIDNMQKRLFGDIFLNCPGNVEEYLERTYGENWLTQGATHNYDHISQQFVKSVKFTLQQEHYQPARPFR